MSIKLKTPCDLDGICPYADMHSGYFNSCEYWCGADEPEDNPDDWDRWECEPSRDDWDTDEDYHA